MSETPSAEALEQVEVTTGSVRRCYKDVTWRQAVQHLFDEVKGGGISVVELGAVGEWTDGLEYYPFRVIPALVNCGLITEAQALLLFKLSGLEFSTEELAEMLIKDAWMTGRKSDAQEFRGVH